MVGTSNGASPSGADEPELTPALESILPRPEAGLEIDLDPANRISDALREIADAELVTPSQTNITDSQGDLSELNGAAEEITQSLEPQNGAAKEITDSADLDSGAEQTESTAVQPKSPHTWPQVLKTALGELEAAGISRWDIAREGVRGSISSGLHWFGQFALFKLTVNALADKSPMAMAYIAAACVAPFIATRLDRVWSDRIEQYGRQFRNYLNIRLLQKHGDSAYAELEDPDARAEKELQMQRANDVEQMIKSSAELPSQVAPLALSLYVLATSSDWTTALLVAASVAFAVTPQIKANFRHAEEDVNLEEAQARRSNIIDKISDGVYSTAGAARMIVGRMTDSIAKILHVRQRELDGEKNLHEMRQTREQRLPDAIFYGSILAGMGTVAFRTLFNGLDLGEAIWAIKLLSELGDEVEGHADTIEGYKTSYLKIKRFYEYLDSSNPDSGKSMPEQVSLSFNQASFVRGDETRRFTAFLPESQIESGDLVVVHGASGAGKTTVLKHLAFACQPATGTIMVDRRPVESIDPKDWYGAIRYCAATPSLQEGLTIREALSLDEGGGDHLEERLKHPLIKDLIAELMLTPTGLNTVIGEGLDNSREFSTGELHRLALVMALVPPPKILFLDEVSSNQSEEFVASLGDAIRSVRDQGCIVIFATHSKQFDPQASHIVKISRGLAEMLAPERGDDASESVD